MAITLVAAVPDTGNTTTSFSIDLPTTAAGDILILEFSHRGLGDGTIGGTSGLTWNLKHSQTFGAASGFSGKLYWARATGNHGGTTVTGSSLTNSCASVLTVYRGAKASGDPLYALVGEANFSGSTVQAEITTTVDGSWVVLTVANVPDIAIDSQACTSPGALAEQAEHLSGGGSDSAICHASAEKASAGATGDFTWNDASSSADGGSWAYAIEPEVEAGTSPIVGTVAVAFTNAAALTGLGSLAGTSPVAFATTATLQGRGALAGSSALAFTTTGAIVAANSAIAGTSAVAFSTSGELAAKGALAGTSAAAFSTAGVLTAHVTTFDEIRQDIIDGLVSAQSEAAGWNAQRVNIPVTAVVRTSGTVVTITLPALPGYDVTAQETITATVPGVALTGGAPLVATPTFTVDETAGAPTIAGTSAVAFTTAGTLTGRGALEGTATLVTAASGALVARGALEGTSTPAFTATAFLGASGALAGVSQAAFSLTGAMGFGLFGTVPLAFSTTGTLTGRGGLAGTSPVSFTGDGALEGRTLLAGTAQSAFTTTATLTARGELAGSATVEFTVAGLIAIPGALAGSSAVTFSLTGVLRPKDLRARTSGSHRPVTGLSSSHVAVTRTTLGSTARTRTSSSHAAVTRTTVNAQVLTSSTSEDS